MASREADVTRVFDINDPVPYTELISLDEATSVADYMAAVIQQQIVSELSATGLGTWGGALGAMSFEIMNNLALSIFQHMTI